VATTWVTSGEVEGSEGLVIEEMACVNSSGSKVWFSGWLKSGMGISDCP
jgi:hypothetical protein